jgi:hypothetical protein
MAANWLCDCGDKLNDGLMRHSHGIFENSTPENVSSNLLFGNTPVLLEVKRYGNMAVWQAGS